MVAQGSLPPDEHPRSHKLIVWRGRSGVPRAVGPLPLLHFDGVRVKIAEIDTNRLDSGRVLQILFNRSGSRASIL